MISSMNFLKNKKNLNKLCKNSVALANKNFSSIIGNANGKSSHSLTSKYSIGILKFSSYLFFCFTFKIIYSAKLFLFIYFF